MYYKPTVLILLLCSFVSFSQEIANTFPLALKSDRDVFQIVNKEKKQISLFISDKKIVKAMRLDEKMNVVDSMSTARPEFKFSEMFGYNIKQSNPRLFWSTSNHKEIYSQLYDFEHKKISDQNYSLTYKDEKYLQQFSENDKFYILTVVKKSNRIKLYVFDNEGKLEEKSILLSGFHFFTNDFTPKPTTLSGVLEVSLPPLEPSYSLQKINPESPTSLSESAKKRKCYSNEKQIVLTFDISVDYTSIIIIDLLTYTATEKIVTKPHLSSTFRADLISNSFLIEDKLFQVKSNGDTIKVTAKDLNDKLIKEYTAVEAGTIDFKNSEIIQETGDFPKNRILEKTSQFMRKINNLNLGISCCKTDDNYLVTVGSVSEQEASGNSMMVGAVLGGFTGVLIVAALSNPTYDSFNSYANRKVVYVNCLFDKDVNHVDGALKPMAFDTMRLFLAENKGTSTQTLFKLNQFYYLGYFDKAKKDYVLRQFQE